MASHRRGRWFQAEDAYLVRLAHTQGALNWAKIAKLIGSRSPKQCRERYHQNLKPSLNHEPISPEEGLQIEHLVGEMGKHWAEIARRLHGRSDNAVKNWWNGSMNRRRRLVLRRRTPNHCSNDFDERSRSVPFARPAENRALTISSSSYALWQARDIPFPSPSVSEASRAESVDGAPSRISDNGSTFSISPRLATSPTIELPPLSSFARDTRRASLPILQFRPNGFLSEADSQAQAFPSRFHGDQKSYALSVLSPPLYRRGEHHHIMPPSPRDSHHDPRSQLPTAPSTPVQLPPLQLTAGPELQGERDSRMHLSSLLG